MERKIEILAPAGSYDGMRAAMNAGCDAVYIGGSSFGARAYANNLTEDQLLEAIEEAHVRDKRLYLTVNTLLKEKELTSRLYDFLKKFYERGLDAVIVQDMGVLHFIHENFPELPVHASTQMTLTMAQGANLLKEYGVTRLVTSRELSLQEIKAIRENTTLEIETFVHGALCYCYSGQCLMSSIIGGRSGNRGRCAQPCRMPYQFFSEQEKLSAKQEKYLLSPKDINTIAMIPELVEVGIDSFKIEGRMKRPEYAAAVASLYRRYTDLYLEHGKEYYTDYLGTEACRKEIQKLQDVYNRGGFSEGYAKNYHGKSMMSLYRPNHSGVAVGEVSAIRNGEVTITLKEDLHAQDILEIRYREEEGYEFTVKDNHIVGETLTTYIGRRQQDKKDKREYKLESGNQSGPDKIRVGNEVFRTKNNRLLEQLATDYLTKDAKLGISGKLCAKIGEPLTLTVSWREFSYTAQKEKVQSAQKQPMTSEKLLAPIEKTGDTLYYFDRLTIDMEENIFVPVAWLNEIRREALEGLKQNVLQSYVRSVAVSSKVERDQTEAKELSEAIEQPHPPRLSVLIQRQEQFEEVLRYSEIASVYAEYDWFTLAELCKMADMANEKGKNFYVSLPQICRSNLYEELSRELIKLIKRPAVTGFILKNLEEIALLQSFGIEEEKKRLILNYNMYTYNKEAKSLYQELGITDYTAPVELNYQELRTLGIEDSDLIVYGYQPVMVSAQCLFESTKGCRRQEQGNYGRLVDRLGKSFFVQANCRGCYNIIYNSQPLSLLKQEEEIRRLHPKGLRLDFTQEGKEEIKKVLAAYIDVFCHGRKPSAELTDYTTGHFKRGIE
jgi:putative protease